MYGEYTKCPRCGLSNGRDDKILSHRIIDRSHDGGDIIVLEEKQCDVCQKIYEFRLYYTLKYAEAANL